MYLVAVTRRPTRAYRVRRNGVGAAQIWPRGTWLDCEIKVSAFKMQTLRSVGRASTSLSPVRRKEARVCASCKMYTLYTTTAGAMRGGRLEHPQREREKEWARTRKGMPTRDDTLNIDVDRVWL